jgi:hypothetical protein
MGEESLSEVNPNDPWDVFQEKYLPEGEERVDTGHAPRRISLRRADRPEDRKLPVRYNNQGPRR